MTHRGLFQALTFCDSVTHALCVYADLDPSMAGRREKPTFLDVPSPTKVTRQNYNLTAPWSSSSPDVLTTGFRARKHSQGPRAGLQGRRSPTAWPRVGASPAPHPGTEMHRAAAFRESNQGSLYLLLILLRASKAWETHIQPLHITQHRTALLKFSYHT